VVAALGGHGEFVENAADLPTAIERALASGKPACINIMVESVVAGGASRRVTGSLLPALWVIDAVLWIGRNPRWHRTENGP
jgi:hypothetical protein